MNHDDHDIHDLLAQAHEPAPTFEAVRDRKTRPARAVLVLVVAGAVMATLIVLSWPSARPVAPAEPIAFDLASPAMSESSLRTPLDSLLVVPGLAVLETTPDLVHGGLP